MGDRAFINSSYGGRQSGLDGEAIMAAMGGAASTGGPTPPVSLLSAIDAGGLYATWASGTPPTFAPDTSPVTVGVLRSAFGATAGAGNTVGAGTLSENRIVTIRKRNPAPDDGTLTADQVVLDDYVLASDSVSNLSSTLTGWKPVAKHRYAPRRLIPGDYPVAVSADHRDGIAAVVFSVTDGITTLTQTVTDPVVANRTGDKGAVQEYQHTFLAAAMAAFSGRVTRNTKVYPRIGVAANVLNSADQTIETRSFCDQYDVVGPKWVIYVDAAGNDSTGVARPISDDATAAASPVATITGAIVRGKALMPNSRVSGLEIRLRAGTWGPPAVTSATYQDANSAEVILTRDPAVPKANVTYSYGTAGTWFLTYLRFADINIVRTAAVFIGSQLATGTGGQVVFRDCNIDLGGINNTAIIGRPHYYEGNCTITGIVGTSFTGTGNCWMQRGNSASALGGTTITADCWDVAGCDYPNISLVNSGAVPESETFIEGSFIRTNASTGTGGITLAATANATVTGIVIRNVVDEYYGGVANTGLRISADGNGSNTEHVVIRGLTLVGAHVAGRANIGYDESSGTTRRTHRGWHVEGLLAGQVNNKSDRFVAVSDTTEAPNRIGAWPVMYGAGFRGTIARYPDAGNGNVGAANFRQDYPGLSARIATNATSPIDVGFTNYQAVTYNGSTYTAGAGGGTYSVASNSVAKNAFTGGRNKFDILGNTRPANDTAGAYV